MPVSDDGLNKVAEWLMKFDYSNDDYHGGVPPNGITSEVYLPDALDLVEKCGLNDTA